MRVQFLALSLYNCQPWSCGTLRIQVLRNTTAYRRLLSTREYESPKTAETWWAASPPPILPLRFLGLKARTRQPNYPLSEEPPVYFRWGLGLYLSHLGFHSPPGPRPFDTYLARFSPLSTVLGRLGCTVITAQACATSTSHPSSADLTY